MMLAVEAKFFWESVCSLNAARECGDEAETRYCVEELEAILKFTDEPSIRERCKEVLSSFVVAVGRVATLAAACVASADLAWYMALTGKGLLRNVYHYVA